MRRLLGENCKLEPSINVGRGVHGRFPHVPLTGVTKTQAAGNCSGSGVGCVLAGCVGFQVGKSNSEDRGICAFIKFACCSSKWTSREVGRLNVVLHPMLMMIK